MVGTKEAEDCFADEADPIYSDGGVFVVQELSIASKNITPFLCTTHACVRHDNAEHQIEATKVIMITTPYQFAKVRTHQIING
uniref:Uncharacterized protein n=1 Tax=Oryza sativa subsp. japonica TaxID=39947 RepID=Q6EP10_ORYSJ|nr:hypothetical protein [Oryza sativa Japonica Group]